MGVQKSGEIRVLERKPEHRAGKILFEAALYVLRPREISGFQPPAASADQPEAGAVLYSNLARETDQKIGCGKTFETDPNRTLKDNYRYFSKNGKRITRLLSPSAFFTPVMAEAFAVDLSRRRDSVVETGYPRNDALYRYTAGQIAEIRERLGIPDGKKVILYAPTWRDRFTDYLAQNQRQTFLRVCDSIDFGRLQRDLGPDYVILFRAHHLDAEAVDLSAYAGFIIDATRYENVNDLLVISDLLISDYSGLFRFRAAGARWSIICSTKNCIPRSCRASTSILTICPASL